MESCSAIPDQHCENKVSLDQRAAVLWSQLGFFFKSSQVLDSIMGLEYFFCFLKGRNRQMHDKRSVIAWTHSLQVLNSCNNTVDCVLSYCSNLLYLQELASAGRLYCLLRLYNCYCGLCIKSLLLSFLMGPGNSDLLLTQSSLVCIQFLLLTIGVSCVAVTKKLASAAEAD